MAGYSTRSLKDKLGLKPTMQAIFIHLPETVLRELDNLDGLSRKTDLTPELNYIHLFTKEKKELERRIDDFRKHIKPSGIIWISWPKGSSKIPTDLNENIVREIALSHGLVDVKICAIDDIWSGLKLVIRIKDRLL